MDRNAILFVLGALALYAWYTFNQQQSKVKEAVRQESLQNLMKNL